MNSYPISEEHFSKFKEALAKIGLKSGTHGWVAFNVAPKFQRGYFDIKPDRDSRYGIRYKKNDGTPQYLRWDESTKKGEDKTFENVEMPKSPTPYLNVMSMVAALDLKVDSAMLPMFNEEKRVYMRGEAGDLIVRTRPDGEGFSIYAPDTTRLIMEPIETKTAMRAIARAVRHVVAPPNNNFDDPATWFGGDDDDDDLPPDIDRTWRY